MQCCSFWVCHKGENNDTISDTRTGEKKMKPRMRLGTAGIAILVLPFAALSETAEVRILKGERAYKLDGRTFVPPMGYVLCGD